MDTLIENFKIPNELMNAPGPRGLELLRIGRMIQKDPLRTYQVIHETWGEFVFCPFPNRLSAFVFSPAAIKRMLKDNHSNYVKGKEYRHLKPLLGDGLLTSEGELWRRQRRVVAKEFHQIRLDIYRSIVEEEIHRLVDHWSNERTLDVNIGLTDATFRIAGKIFFGTDLGSESSKAKWALEAETDRVNKRILRAFNLPRSFPCPENIKGERAVKELKGIVEDVIAKGHSEDNILSRLAGFRDHNDESMAPNLVRDEVMTLLLAGHETTSNGLSWALYLLAQNPQWQTKIANNPSGEMARACFYEAIRIYPPVPLLSRMSLAPDVLDGNYIPANVSVNALQWITHRDPKYWDRALEFDPTRFAGTKPPTDGSYFPFAMGPRACIGEALAMLEGEIGLQRLVEAFEFSLKPEFEPKLGHHLTLRSDNGMWLEIKKRQG